MRYTSTTNLKALKPLHRDYERTGRLLLEDNLSLFRHPRSPLIWADIRLPEGKRKRQSTGTTDFARAVEIAKRQQKELLGRVATGQPISISGVTVGQLLTAYSETLMRELASGDTSVKPELSVLRKNLIPYWSEVPISALSRQTFYAWEEFRAAVDTGQATVRAYKRGGRAVQSTHTIKPPSLTTLQREKTYFVRALTWGSDQVQPWLTDEAVEEIRHLPRRSKKSKKIQNNRKRRTALSDTQIAALLREAARWEEVEENRPDGQQRNYQRRLMMCHVRLLLASGLRPGAEINELTWDKIKVESLKSGGKIIVISYCGNGKTGPRPVNTTPEAIQVLNDLRRLLTTFGFPTVGSASLWPHPRGGTVKDFNGSFKTAMRRLKFEVNISEEPLYICRHTYITQRLRKNVSSDIIAENCGTSVEMIKNHYKHLNAEQIRDALEPIERMEINELTLAPPENTKPLAFDSSGKSLHLPAKQPIAKVNIAIG